jgi:hypothetical protein
MVNKMVEDYEIKYVKADLKIFVLNKMIKDRDKKISDLERINKNLKFSLKIKNWPFKEKII